MKDDAMGRVPEPVREFPEVGWRAAIAVFTHLRNGISRRMPVCAFDARIPPKTSHDLAMRQACTVRDQVSDSVRLITRQNFRVLAG